MLIVTPVGISDVLLTESCGIRRVIHSYPHEFSPYIVYMLEGRGTGGIEHCYTLGISDYAEIVDLGGWLQYPHE